MPQKASPGPGTFGRLVIRVIKGRLKQRGGRQADLAIHAAISASQVSRILSFQKELTVDQLEGFCLALQEEITDVIDLAQDERVWGSRDERVVDGWLVAGDPLSSRELYLLRCEEGARTTTATADARGEVFDGTVREWDDSLPYAADSSPDEDELRYERGESFDA